MMWMKEGYKPRSEKFYTLSAACRDESELAKWFDKLERAPRQQESLMSFLSQVGGLGKAMMGTSISRTELLKNPTIQPAAWLELINKGIAAVQADGTYAQIQKKYFGDQDIYNE